MTARVDGGGDRVDRVGDRVGVVGLGTMGAGIVEVLARSGLQVVAVEADEAGLERGRGHLERSTARAVARGRLSEADRQQLLGRVALARDLAELADCDLVVEAVPERLDLKRDLVARLDAVVRPDAVLATNTSSLPVTEIAAATRRPGRVVGLHFFNPAPVLRLVEVVRTVVSEDDVVDAVVALATRIGKTPVVVTDRAGFVANALLFGYLNRAVAMVESGHATTEDVDTAMVLGCGLPMGPLALLDLIGLDTAQEILETMYRQGGDRLHVPRPLLRQLVTAGRLGRKTGHGFYPYTEPGSAQVVPSAGAARPHVGSHERVRTVRRVGVVAAEGSLDGPAAPPDADLVAGLATDLAAAGLDVTTATTGALDGLGDVDLVVEAVADEAVAKRDLLAALDEVCRPGAILATMSSAVPVVACAAATSRARDVVGLHVHAAGPGGGLVEVVPAVGTAHDVVATVVDLCRRLGRHPVTCGDRAGAVVEALLHPYLNDAVRMIEVGYADADAVDVAMTAGCGYPRGPIQVLDELGLDVVLAGQRRLYEESREPGLVPSALLQQLVTAGRLGARTGRGVREHG